MLKPDRFELVISVDYKLFGQVRGILVAAFDTIASDPARIGRPALQLPIYHETSLFMSRPRRNAQGLEEDPGEQLVLFNRVEPDNRFFSAITYWRLVPDEDHINSAMAFRKGEEFLGQTLDYFKDQEANWQRRTRWQLTMRSYHTGQILGTGSTYKK